MSEYRLQMVFNPSDLKEVMNARQRIMLAKPVSGGGPSTVWQAIDPFQSTEISWKEEYGLYASTTAFEHGASINKISETGVPAQDGTLYTLSAQHVFEGPAVDPNVPAGTFAALNEVPYANYPTLTFGLTQTALINQKPSERKPVSASPVLSTQQVEITPFTEVYMWLQADFESETIITHITGNYSVVKFGGGVNDIVVEYDPNIGQFVSQSG